MNLYIFPSRPTPAHGYGIAVIADLAKLQPKDSDLLIWYDNKPWTYFNNDRTILRPKSHDISRAIKVLGNRVNCELEAGQLKDIDPAQIDEVFCGEVIFYRALREIFPDKKITVRFHNCFARIKDRVELLDAKVNLKLKIQMRAFYKLEKEIFQDKNAYKIFISDEDRDYYTSHFGIWSDSEVWGFAPDMEKAKANRVDCKKTKLVHFGGMQSHKIDAMKWFVNEVFIPFHNINPNVEFHLWGGGTKPFDDSANNIFGHGFYDGNDLPEAKEGLFINPDIIGGGVKIKMINYFEKGASFITTPYGYEGYPKSLLDDKFYYMVENDKWLDFLTKYFA